MHIRRSLPARQVAGPRRAVAFDGTGHFVMRSRSLPKPKKASRTRLVPEARVPLILENALDLFARQNYASVTTRDIAKACGVNVALIYYYFGNKEGLFRAVIQHAMDKAYRTYANRTREMRDPAREIVEWFQVNVDQFTSLKKMAQICVAYNSTGTLIPEVDSLIKKIYRDELRLLGACIRRGIDGGQFRAVDAAATATFISTQLDGVCFVSMTRPETDVTPILASARDLILDYLQRDKRPRASVAAGGPVRRARPRG